jgi:hypothetical protein
MNPEVIALDKYIKKEYPFVVEVLGYGFENYRGEANANLYISIEVSSSHFCELFFHEIVESKVNNHMSSKLTPMISAVISEWSGKGDLSFRFFPQDMGKNYSVLNYLV